MVPRDHTWRGFIWPGEYFLFVLLVHGAKCLNKYNEYSVKVEQMSNKINVYFLKINIRNECVFGTWCNRKNGLGRNEAGGGGSNFYTRFLKYYNIWYYLIFTYLQASGHLLIILIIWTWATALVQYCLFF